MENNDKFWELATAKLHNENSDSESAELDGLLENEKNKKLYQEINKLKNEVGEVENISGISQNKSWNMVSNHLRTKTIQLVLNITKYAAIIVFAFFLGSLITSTFNKQTEISGFAEVKVPLGQMSEVTLFDGTKVWLNSGTTLRYSNNFGKEERNISLEGEAFFEVTKDEIPFKVKLKNTEVEVLGTTFNVVSYSDDVFSEITLVEGKVNVNNLSGSTIAVLKPSERIYIDDILNKASISKVETNFYTSWIDGKIVFDDEKLAEITRKLERWYNVDIQLEEASLGELHFTGTILKHKPFNQIITAFELLLPIDIKYTSIPNGKDMIVISKK
jgi:ferric-dicitrate binding protein FerR (iron transport regulator)